MSEPAVTSPSVAVSSRRRGWLYLASTGVALVVLALIVIALVLFDKPQFGGLVGSMFLPIVTSGVLTGAILVLIGTWNLPERTTWRGWTLTAWALVALGSPLMGIMFMLPFGLLAIATPLVIAILMRLFRT